LDRNIKEALISAVLFFVVLYGFVRLVGIPISFIISGSIWPTQNTLEWQLLNLEYGVFLLSTPILVYKFIFKRSLEDLGLNFLSRGKINIKYFAYGICIGFVSMAISLGFMVMVIILVNIIFPQSQILQFQKAAWLIGYKSRELIDRILMIILTIFLIIPAEETFYRGFLQGTFSRVMKPQTAIVLAAIFFSIGQGFLIPFVIWYLMIGGFTVGLLNGYLFFKTKSLFPCFVAHLTFLAITFLMGWL
jgi:membrane protease YdiL (CAAX protease family)